MYKVPRLKRTSQDSGLRDVGVASNPSYEFELDMARGDVGGNSRPSTMKEGGPIILDRNSSMRVIQNTEVMIVVWEWLGRMTVQI